MALLSPTDDRDPIALAAHTLIGRGQSCLVRLADRRVSSEHAALSYKAGAWRVRDLGSRNGTWVDGDRLDPGEERGLTVGSRLGFASEATTWQLVDASPPGAVALHLADRTLHPATDGAITLPDDAHVELSVLRRLDGWVVETADGETHALRDGEVLNAGGAAWQVFLPRVVEATAGDTDRPCLLAEGTLAFRVSLDEEYVELTVRHPQGDLELAPRAHHYLLLTLARLRRDEHAERPFEQGWVHHQDLQGMLDLDRLALNTQVSRARRQLAAAGLEDAAAIVERRASTGHLRIGVPPERLIVEP